ncbi:MAG TPA: DUF1697 domain-containing protein [Gemmataceae bacterium]|nr:DUF1697 domain-containing protein [Gemmataceae bacterium]
MSARQIALFRGINVGRAKRIAMADLRAAFERLGYRDVRTLLNSGNVVFTGGRGSPAAAATRIEKAINSDLGVSARVTVLTAAELAASIAENPLDQAADNPSRFLLAVLRDPADRTKVAPLAKRDWTPEALALGTRVAYLWCADGILASALGAAVGKALGDGVTARNWSTMLKLNSLAQESG